MDYVVYALIAIILIGLFICDVIYPRENIRELQAEVKKLHLKIYDILEYNHGLAGPSYFNAIGYKVYPDAPTCNGNGEMFFWMIRQLDTEFGTEPCKEKERIIDAIRDGWILSVYDFLCYVDVMKAYQKNKSSINSIIKACEFKKQKKETEWDDEIMLKKPSLVPLTGNELPDKPFNEYENFDSEMTDDNSDHMSMEDLKTAIGIINKEFPYTVNQFGYGPEEQTGKNRILTELKYGSIRTLDELDKRIKEELYLDQVACFIKNNSSISPCAGPDVPEDGILEDDSAQFDEMLKTKDEHNR